MLTAPADEKAFNAAIERILVSHFDLFEKEPDGTYFNGDSNRGYNPKKIAEDILSWLRSYREQGYT